MFLLVGVINTVVGLSICYACYNLIGLDYWTSSALDYILASALSYYLNNRYTFQYKKIDIKSIVKFSLNILTCYVIAFSLARPLTRWMLEQLNLGITKSIIENVAILVGSGLFTIINYLGQRFFAFKRHSNAVEVHAD
jgi:putative flippase GtrA